MALFCKHCGAELDEHDVNANLATWDVFRMVCIDEECMLYEDLHQDEE